MLLAIAPTTLGQAAAAPRAVVAQATQNAGVVAPGEEARATFRIENQGDAPLTLTPGKPLPYVAGVETSVEGAPVAPGGAATVTMKLATEALAGAGQVHVPVETNDPAAKTIGLTMDVEVQPLLTADPGYVRYNVVQHEREGTITQTIASTDGATFKVVGVESPVPALRASFREAGADERRAPAGSEWRVETVLAADAPVGALAGDLVVTTDHPRQKRLRIPVSGFVRPVVAVTPPEADVGEVDGARPFRFVLDVKTFASEPIAIERATCDLPGATTEIVPVQQGRAYKVRVSVPAGLPDGALAGAVRIFTASKKVPQLEVPVRGRVVVERAPADRDGAG